MSQADFPLCIYCNAEVKVLKMKSEDVVTYCCYKCNTDIEVELVRDEGLLSNSGCR